MHQRTRREFLQDSALLAGALAGAGWSAGSLSAAKKAKEKPGEANDRIHVAVVGVNGRGMEHVKGFAGRNNCAVTTICDCDEGVISRAMEAVEEVQGHTP